MRAVWLKEFGGPEVLVPGDAPEPESGPGELVVDVAYAGITFVDTLLRAGRSPDPTSLPVLPIIPGNGVGGVVTELGAGVESALLGRRVVSSAGGSGGYAERVAVDAAWPVPVPPALTLADAVALQADGRTALGLFRAADVRPGERVLVEAAAGGVGSLLVQLCVEAGAQVVGAASTADKRQLAHDLGAARTVDYTRRQWTERVGWADVVFDGVGGAVGAVAYGLVVPGGRFCAYGAAGGPVSRPDPGLGWRRDVRVLGLDALPHDPARLAHLTADALDLAATGRLHPVIGQRVPVDYAADAHMAMERREVLGKSLLVVSDTEGPR